MTTTKINSIKNHNLVFLLDIVFYITDIIVLELKTKRVYISKHVVFDESTFLFANLSSSGTLQESPKLVKNKWFLSSATNVEELNPITSSCDNIPMLVPICYALHTSKNFDFAETSKTTTPSHETMKEILSLTQILPLMTMS